jgi:hypothetical protein
MPKKHAFQAPRILECTVVAQQPVDQVDEKRRVEKHPAP